MRVPANAPHSSSCCSLPRLRPRSSGSEAAAAAKAILAEVPLERLYFVQGGADAWQVRPAWGQPTRKLGATGGGHAARNAWARVCVCRVCSRPAAAHAGVTRGPLLHQQPPTPRARLTLHAPHPAPTPAHPPPRQASGNPWKEPSAPFSFSLPDIDLASLDLSGATKTIAGGVQTTAAAVTTLASDFESAPASAKGLLAAVGVVGASAFLFSQVWRRGSCLGPPRLPAAAAAAAAAPVRWFCGGRGEAGWRWVARCGGGIHTGLTGCGWPSGANGGMRGWLAVGGCAASAAASAAFGSSPWPGRPRAAAWACAGGAAAGAGGPGGCRPVPAQGGLC